MKTLYIECNMGAAGDMLMAAMLELHPDREDFLRRLNALGIPNVTVEAEKSVKCGITGTHVNVFVKGEKEENVHHHHKHEAHGAEHEHHHSGMGEIEHILSHLKIPGKVFKDALSVYNLIAEAESYVHGRPVEHIHFHEVGTMDALADIVGTCMLIDELAPEKIIVSPVNTGSGQVRCAHGVLPVPAPATAYILHDAPIYSTGIQGELCTPTGAALLKYFAAEFAPMPLMRVSKIGYGMGSKDFDAANCVRAVIGESKEERESVIELCCNIDDMTGEETGYAMNKLLESGALEVYTSPVYMKKNRPGILLSCMCRETERENMLELIFKYTSTIGVREHISNRYVLKRGTEEFETEYGKVRAKVSSGYGVKRVKAEYEDIARIADERGLSLDEVKDMVYKINK